MSKLNYYNNPCYRNILQGIILKLDFKKSKDFWNYFAKKKTKITEAENKLYILKTRERKIKEDIKLLSKQHLPPRVLGKGTVRKEFPL